MNDPTCQDCKHFRQHYVHIFDEYYHTIPCGHCVYPRLKHRRPDTLACVHFTSKEERTPKQPDQK